MHTSGHMLEAVHEHPIYASLEYIDEIPFVKTQVDLDPCVSPAADWGNKAQNEPLDSLEPTNPTENAAVRADI